MIAAWGGFFTLTNSGTLLTQESFSKLENSWMSFLRNLWHILICFRSRSISWKKGDRWQENAEFSHKGKMLVGATNRVFEEANSFQQKRNRSSAKAASLARCFGSKETSAQRTTTRYVRFLTPHSHPRLIFLELTAKSFYTISSKNIECRKVLEPRLAVETVLVLFWTENASESCCTIL